MSPGHFGLKNTPGDERTLLLERHSLKMRTYHDCQVNRRTSTTRYGPPPPTSTMDDHFLTGLPTYVTQRTRQVRHIIRCTQHLVKNGTLVGTDRQSNETGKQDHIANIAQLHQPQRLGLGKAHYDLAFIRPHFLSREAVHRIARNNPTFFKSGWEGK